MRLIPSEMESSVLVNDVPKFQGGFRTSPEPEERSAWEELASSHPHLVEELAGRLPAWVTSRKRRGSRDRAESDFAPEGRSRQLRDIFLNDFPSEFRHHIPADWSQHFDSGDAETQPQCSTQQSSQATPKFERQQSSEKGTQTLDGGLVTGVNPNLNQYKLRNTVDLGQKTATELGHLDAEAARNQRSMSAPPDSRVSSHSSLGAGASVNMVNPQQQQEPPHQHHEESSATSANNKQPNVRHIPIFVEGRDEPVINAHKDTCSNFAESRPTPPREDYFMEHEIPQSFHPTPHFSRAFGSPFKGFSNKNMSGFGPKIFNQNNDQSQHKFTQQPKQPSQSHTTHPPQAQANYPSQQQANHPSQPEPTQPDQNQQKDITDAPEQKPHQPAHHHISNDPIEKIQLIQKDVLELMSRVETFKGTSKKDKDYIYLDEMLTRNLIKLDDIETEGKENIRLARKEAIKCIQQCIAVLEARADSNAEAELQQKKLDDSNMGQDSASNETCKKDAEQKEPGKSDDCIHPTDMDVETSAMNVSSERDPSDNIPQEPKPMEVDANTSSQ